MPAQLDYYWLQNNAQQQTPNQGAFNGNPGTIYNRKPGWAQQVRGLTNPNGSIGPVDRLDPGISMDDPQVIPKPPMIQETKPQANPQTRGFNSGAGFGFNGFSGGGMPMPQFRPGFSNGLGYGFSNDSGWGMGPWMGGQNANLGRYAPPMFDMSGRSINQGQGGYAYNLPNAYGPFPMFSQFGMGRNFYPPGG